MIKWRCWDGCEDVELVLILSEDIELGGEIVKREIWECPNCKAREDLIIRNKWVEDTQAQLDLERLLEQDELEF